MTARGVSLWPCTDPVHTLAWWWKGVVLKWLPVSGSVP